jgi:initiation factor 1A
MTKNKFGGNKHKKVKRGNRNKVGVFNEESGDYYAKVVKINGGNRINVHLHDGRDIDIIIPGRYRKKVWIRKDDLICCTEYEMKWKVETEGEKYNANKYFVQKNEEDGTIFEEYDNNTKSDDSIEELNNNIDNFFGNQNFDEI